MNSNSYLAACSPAIRCSPRKKLGAAAAVGFRYNLVQAVKSKKIKHFIF